VPYLSRIYLNPARRHARRLLVDPQATHAIVLAGLPTQPVHERVLWRLDAQSSRRPALFVLTHTPPSWEHLTEQAGWPSSDTADDPQVTIRDYKPLLDRLKCGDEYAFRLTANPVQTTKHPVAPTLSQLARSENGSRGRSVRVGHRTVATQTAWLLDRGQRWGFEIPNSTARGPDGKPAPDVAVVARTRIAFRHKPKPVVVQVVSYEGRIRVTNAELLRQAMLNGLGPAKAYGCGLMTLAPTR
jgi:CRISPR system Cascade subunit CasE